MSHNVRKQGFGPGCDINRPVKSQKARSLNILILEEEGLYYLKSENKGADELCSYCTADQICSFIFIFAKILFSCDLAQLN